MAHPRDEEIQRLIHYAKSLGIKIVFYQKGSATTSAGWNIDESLIMVYASKNKSKTEIILDLIHELGHVLWHIHQKDRLPDTKFEEALMVQNLYEIDTVKPTSKKLRKRILDVEIAGTQWWEVIYKDVNLKIPIWKISVAKEFDMWAYQCYYENGHFPNRKMRIDMLKEITKKHKPTREAL